MSKAKGMKEIRINIPMATYMKIRKIVKQLDGMATISDVCREAIGRHLHDIALSPSEVRELVRIKKEAEKPDAPKKKRGCKACKCENKKTVKKPVKKTGKRRSRKFNPARAEVHDR